MKKLKLFLLTTTAIIYLAACSDDDKMTATHDPNTAEKVSVDRFSATAGHLQVRTATNGLPAANAPVNFDQGPFITKGFGPGGQLVEYYNFDVQSTTPAPIWVLFKQGESNPVSDQMNIINVLPGEAGYNDFWQVIKVTVPASYQANQVASYDEIVAAGYPLEPTTSLVNCPVVPEGSTATKRFTGEPAGLIKGWYKGKVVSYFTFGEKELMTSAGKVPLSPIYVSFKTNLTPGNDQSGPASGFKTEPGSTQTHNVVSTLPSNAGYSPLWIVSAYDNADFDAVNNLATAQAATSAGDGIAMVNCPLVSSN
ncbi:hypothetical protein [Chryseolinea soli]|uniref:Lipoprotein n=1 Tax=Chryseolinea soli TaxID=2321403 RepID=A0A385SXV1_9BACT|nr:hypothetical protein [Chryseolinea soli]AYB34907.1 hypothetical protein D4L85_31915 [Chryseolinea soli]